VVGVWTKMTDTPAEYVQAIREMVDVAGIDHVCIGTDSKLTPGQNGGGFGGKGGPPDGGKGGFGDGKGGFGDGKSGFGGGKGGPPGGPGGNRRRGNDRTNEQWADQKVGFLYAVVGEMLKQGFAAEEISKVGGGNFCRVFDACTAG
jgi:membrane dipeptidase